MHNLIIIGTGPAGITAAIYAARAGLRPIVYAGLQPGGQLTTTTEVENFPGFEAPIMGPELMAGMTNQAIRVGAEVVPKEITRVDFSSRILRLWVGDDEIQSKAVIISTGAKARLLGLPNEGPLMGKGLSTCATCDGFFYKGKKVAVVGGGDSAMEEALYLSKLCERVLLVHRRDYFRASKIMLERVRKNDKIELLVPYEVDTLQSSALGLTGVMLKNSETGETREEPLDGLFYAIGHMPNTGLFQSYLDTDSAGYLTVRNFTETKVPGVYAAGDVADPTFRQAITAAGMGCQAAIQASHYIDAWSEN